MLNVNQKSTQCLIYFCFLCFYSQYLLLLLWSNSSCITFGILYDSILSSKAYIVLFLPFLLHSSFLCRNTSLWSFPMPIWYTCLMHRALTSPSSAQMSSTVFASRHLKRSFSKTCPAAMDLLRLNTWLRKITASTSAILKFCMWDGQNCFRVTQWQKWL